METPKSSQTPALQDRKPSEVSPKSNPNGIPHDPAGHVTPPRPLQNAEPPDFTLRSEGTSGGPSKEESAGTDELAEILDHLHIRQHRPWYLSLLETPPVSGSLRPTSEERERDRRLRGRVSSRGVDDLCFRLGSDVTPPKYDHGAHERDPWRSRSYDWQRLSTRRRSPLRVDPVPAEELTVEMRRLKEVMGFTSFFSPKEQWRRNSQTFDEQEEDEVPITIFHL